MLCESCTQVLVGKEIFRMCRNINQDRKVPLLKTQQWYFFSVATLFLYSRHVSCIIP